MWSSRSKLLEEGTFASLNWQLWIRGQYPMVTALAIPVIGPNSEQYTQISAGRIYSDDHTVYCMPSGQLVNTLAMEAHFRSPTSNSVTNPKESSSQIREWTNSELHLMPLSLQDKSNTWWQSGKHQRGKAMYKRICNP